MGKNMNIYLRLASVIWILSAALPAGASTMTFNFNEFANQDFGGAGAGAPVGPISFNNANHGTYNTFLPAILLGDDGWSNEITFYANAGFQFDALSLTLRSGFQGIWKSMVTAAVDLGDPFAQLDYALDNDTLEQVIYPNVIFKGFRGGAQVAAREVTYIGAAPEALSFDASFAELDAFQVSLDFMGADYFMPTIMGDYLLHCPAGRCGLLEFDDLALNVEPAGASAPAPVPLPGAGLMLGAAILGAAGFRRQKGDA